MAYKKEYPLNTLGFAHEFIARHVGKGEFCMDATAGNGGDTKFLAKLVGPTGRVLAFDIQEQAVTNTRIAMEQEGYGDFVQVVLDSHSNMDNYAQPNTVDCIVFNFGWLPGGDHTIYTTASTSIPAIEKALTLLKKGGFISLCIYYGGVSGYEERDALLEYLKTIDQYAYTVLLTQFANRRKDPPIPVFIIKE